MHVANCEYFLLSISCKMNADQSLFVVDLNERRGNRTYLVWSIVHEQYDDLRYSLSPSYTFTVLAPVELRFIPIYQIVAHLAPVELRFIPI